MSGSHYALSEATDDSLALAVEEHIFALFRSMTELPGT